MSIATLRARRKLWKDTETVTADIILLIVGNAKTKRLACHDGRS